MELFTILGVVLLVLLVPVKIAGNYLGAKRTGFGWCFLAMLMAASFVGLGQQFTDYGAFIALFAAGAGFSFIMGTTYIKGLGIAAFQIVSTIGLVALLASINA